MPTSRIDKEVQRISMMGRKGLVRMLRKLHCDFELDFTDEFLRGVSLERLRHIAVAAALHTHGETPADARLTNP